MENRGKFIVFEGLDGSGKSTQIDLFVKYLESIGHKVLVTKEPTKGPVGMLLRKYLDGDTKPSQHMLQLLFAADRDEHVHKEIMTALEKGITVVCDRYIFSSMAYGAIDVDMLWLSDVNKNFLMPDLTFYIRVPAIVCYQRIVSRNKNHTLFEKTEQLEQAFKNYDRITRTFPNIAIIDGNRAVDEVFNSVKDAAKEKLNLKVTNDIARS